MSHQVPAHFGANFTKTTHDKPNESTDPSKVTLQDGYTVLITGAGKGIGSYIARSYALAKASNIIVVARTASDLDKLKVDLEAIAKTQGRQVTVRPVPADASKLETYKELRSIIENEFNGRLDCLVNNAGSMGSNQGYTDRIDETDPEEHARLFELNYLGPFYAMQQLIPVMISSQSKGKLIVNITSAACHMTSWVPIAYSVSKLAQNRLTQQVGEQYKSDGLVCIALHPGAVKSYSAQFVPDALKAMLNDDIGLAGAMCVWFSKEPRPWASGRFISSKWDVDELEKQKDEIEVEDKLKFRMVV